MKSAAVGGVFLGVLLVARANTSIIPARSEPIGDCGAGFNPYDAST